MNEIPKHLAVLRETREGIGGKGSKYYAAPYDVVVGQDVIRAADIVRWVGEHPSATTEDLLKALTADPPSIEGSVVETPQVTPVSPTRVSKVDHRLVPYGGQRVGCARCSYPAEDHPDG